MTTDVDQGYFQWSQEELTQRDASTGVTISQMLDHGSVSFGKFEFESLSWEKWSVFRHDRRQEELERFNGLVAEKKAYFEEYYKRMRALKALQQQQQQQEEQARQQIQQTELTLDYSVDGSLSEEEHETETGRKDEPEMETGMVVEPRNDSEESTVVENSGAGFSKSEMQIVGDAKSGRLVTKKPVGGGAILKEPSGSSRPRPGAKQNLKPQRRPVVQKPQPPPPPPPRRIIRKTDSTSNLKVRTKEATRTVPVSGTATPSTSAATKRPSSSASMRSSRTSGTKDVSRTIPVSSTATTSAATKRPSSSASMRSSSRTSGTKEAAATSTIAVTKRPTSSASMRRPVSSSGNRSSSAPRRPLSSAGDRGKRVADKVQRPDLSSSRMEAIARGKMSPSIHSTPRMNIIPSTVKSITTESKSRQVPKEPLVSNSNSTAARRTERYTLDSQKSRSINLPPKKNSCTSGASENFSRNKNKEAPAKAATQPRTPARSNMTPAQSSTPVRNTALLHNTESNKIGTPRKPIPTRTSETPRVGGRHHPSSPSVSTRKPKTETKSWR